MYSSDPPLPPQKLRALRKGAREAGAHVGPPPVAPAATAAAPGGGGGGSEGAAEDVRAENRRLKAQNASLMAQLKDIAASLDEALLKRQAAKASVKGQIDKLERALQSQRREAKALQGKLDEAAGGSLTLERLEAAQGALVDKEAELKALRSEVATLKRQARRDERPVFGNYESIAEAADRIRAMSDELAAQKVSARSCRQGRYLSALTFCAFSQYRAPTGRCSSSMRTMSAPPGKRRSGRAG